jgi:Nucleopolyhedrovirus protein of unknown function (DUF884)
MLSTINSINIFVFKVGSPIDNDVQTRLVSGYERGGLRNIGMSVECVASYDRHAYLISCVRVPYLLTKLIAHENFSQPVAPLVVQYKHETQVWHVFGMCKGKELSSIANVRGVAVCENGIETFVAKELIALRGNVPAGFVAALSKNSPNVQDIDVLKCVYPWLIVNAEDVSVVTAK